ncbi:MAG: hypothetical protein IRY88_17135, partial [Rubrobacteraceae bacterium]|nr:hypothetical protein [Rubrobacteraceae bacterium]
ITVSATAFAVFLLFCLYEWVVRPVYAVNSTSSIIYMLILYAVALVLYVGFRIYRRSQGIDMSMVYSEIPED